MHKTILFILIFHFLLQSQAFKTTLSQNSLSSSSSSSPSSSSSSSTDLETALTWQTQTPSNTAPSPRGGITSIVDGNILVIFGGCYLDMECFNDLYYYTTSTTTWSTPQFSGAKPSARGGHTAQAYGVNMYIFGGSGVSNMMNDLFAFNLLTSVWTQLNYPGPIPTARANHGMTVDNLGRLIIFGGYTTNGYVNDLYMADTINQRWTQPYISGTAPSPREGMSMTYIANQNAVYIFGGYGNNGALNDLWILDLQSLTWKNETTYGPIPSSREGHLAILDGTNLIISGGCNFKLNTCYSDTTYLDITSLWWSALPESAGTVLNLVYQQSASVIGQYIYAFGGCTLLNACYNTMNVFNDNDPCPNQCNSNGICRNNICMCTSGYFGNDCSLSTTCPSQCSEQGSCQSEGTCACYPGYTGDICNVLVNCPNNCTSETNGICQVNATCTCNPGWTGDSCSQSTKIALCPDNCSNNGACNALTGQCLCYPYASGANCNITSLNSTQISSLSNSTSAQIAAATTNTVNSSSSSTSPSSTSIQSQSVNPLSNTATTSVTSSSPSQTQTQTTPTQSQTTTTQSQTTSTQPQSTSTQSQTTSTQPQTTSTQSQTTPTQSQITTTPSSTTSTQSQTTPTQTQTTSTQPQTTSTQPQTNSTQSQTTSTQSSQTTTPTQSQTTTPTQSQKTTSTKPQTTNTTQPQTNSTQQQKTTSTQSQANTTQSQTNLTQSQTTPTQSQTSSIQTQTTTSAKTQQQTSPTLNTKLNLNLSNSSLILPNSVFPVGTMTPMMFGGVYPSEQQLQENMLIPPSTEPLTNCPNSCSMNGVCVDSKCYCQRGYTGTQCSSFVLKNIQNGFTLGRVFYFCSICIGAGVVIGLVLIWYIVKRTEEVEMMSIDMGNKPEQAQET